MNNGTKKTHCKHGHDISVVGRNTGGACRGCQESYTNSPKRTEQRFNSKWSRDGIVNEQGLPFLYADFNRHFQIQGGLCKLCSRHQSEFDRALCVDHDHETGKFRALLCASCNRNMVGKHTLETAIALVEYLKKPI